MNIGKISDWSQNFCKNFKMSCVRPSQLRNWGLERQPVRPLSLNCYENILCGQDTLMTATSEEGSMLKSINPKTGK